MQLSVFVLTVGWCLDPQSCMAKDTHWTTEGVFESLNECQARGAYLRKGEPMPSDFILSMYYCEQWQVPPKGSPLSTARKADAWDHIKPPMPEKH